jgi:hypothetical protein
LERQEREGRTEKEVEGERLYKGGWSSRREGVENSLMQEERECRAKGEAGGEREIRTEAGGERM